MDAGPALRQKVWRGFARQILSILAAALLGAVGAWVFVAHRAGDLGGGAALAAAFALLLGLCLPLALAWWSYRGYVRALGPLHWLAGQVRRYDPRDPGHGGFAPESLPPDMDAETRVLASSLHQLAREVEAVLERERRFTRDASHELRTPLTVIRMATDLLLADPDQSPYSQRALRRIQDSGRDMEALIESFLLLARAPDLDTGGEEARVAQVVYEQVEDARPLLRNKPVELHVQADCDFSVQAPARVVSVLLGNLIRNACVFTDSGRIDVRIGRGEVVVEDSGIGMSPDVLARAFEPFYRLGDGRRGHGIGLSIVRRLGDRFGWQIVLESTPEQGTVASVRFPNAEVIEPEADVAAG
ncbi:sensor histidine kinase [Coralloluteibacterium thermophilus]|uniref:histidine kinase n=1 Tax=Coralloluteibacterium thermophilum TaxID=2707049 RepID=A0ABV9NMN8_9GAMM